MRISFIVLFLLLCSCATEFRPPEGVVIPRNLPEAYVELDQMFTEEQKDQFRSGEIAVEDMVLTFGMRLKEYWGLWKDSKIAKYMRKQDIEHPDQMITVIFTGYFEYLNEQTAD